MSAKPPRPQDAIKPDPDALSMPPPPPPARAVILEPELQALTDCLKNAIIKTGQIYSFYVDRVRLQHPYKPPNSLVAALGREIEKYDQLCDSIESQLLRAIAVLRRDLKREEQRKKDALAAAKARATDSLRPMETIANLEVVSSETPAAPTSSPVAAFAGPGRRPSAISLSSLQRPTAPLKLDLSAASLRMPDDPALFSGGLASPVTLAPKSARPLGSSEFTPELMAALASANATGRPVDIDLTAEDDDSRLPMTLDGPAGSSADKPIELDLDTMDMDMADIFGDAGGQDSRTDTKTTMEGLFSSHKGAMGNSGVGRSAIGGNDALPDFSSSDQPGHPPPPTNTNLSTIAATTPSFDISSLDLNNLSPGFFSNTADTDIPFSMDEFLAMGGNAGEPKDNGTNLS